MYLSVESFGECPGRAPLLYVMENENGLRLSVTDYGARVVSLLVPDGKGEFKDVVLGFGELAPYLLDLSCIGATCGRVANRIENGEFSIGEKTYQVTRNEGIHCLHGGEKGLDARFWESEFTPQGLRLTYDSPDGEEGFPGNARISLTFLLTDDNVVSMTYETTTDQDTPISLTNHCYFNLDGREALGATHHLLTLEADAYLPVEADLIPKGALAPVAGTPFDFTTPRRVGSRIGNRDPQLLYAAGYDHCFALRGEAGELKKAATLTGESGRTLTLYTTFPGLQLYTANHQDRPHCAVCLEPQYYPNSVNLPAFPSPIVRAGETQVHRTEWHFSNLGDEA